MVVRRGCLVEETLGERGGLGNDSGGPRWFVLRRGWGWGGGGELEHRQ